MNTEKKHPPTIYYPENTMPFGAYKGDRLRDIYYYNPIYIEWLVENVDSFCLGIKEFEKIGSALKPVSKKLLFRIPKESEGRMTPDQRTSFMLKLIQTNPRIKDIKEYEDLGFIIPSKEYNLPDKIVQINKTKFEIATKINEKVTEDKEDLDNEISADNYDDKMMRDGYRDAFEGESDLLWNVD
jgi:hypothetical protein